jgi:hypothetical protein
MDNVPDILTILTEAAPLVLSTIILGAIMLFGLYASIKIVIPAMVGLVEMTESQRKSWLSIVEEQKRINVALVAEIQHDLSAEKVERKKLAVKVEELSADIARKDTRIAELQLEIDNLRKIVTEKDFLVLNLQKELRDVIEDRKRIEIERNELVARVSIVEANQIKTS